MARPISNLKGRTIGEWLVLERGESTPKGAIRWKCRCSCTKESLVLASNLKSKRSLSCVDCSKAVPWLPEEKSNYKNLCELVEKASKTLRNPDLGAQMHANANAEVNRYNKQIKELLAAIEQRKQSERDAKAQEFQKQELARIEAEFPIPDPPPTGMAAFDFLARLNKEKNKHKDGPIRTHLLLVIAVVEERLREHKQELDAAKESRRTEQTGLNQNAFDVIDKDIFSKVHPILRKNNLALELRTQLSDHCKQMQDVARESMKTATGYNATGAENAAIAKHVFEVYSKLVEQLKFYTVSKDFTHEWSYLDAAFWEDFALSPENYNFRTVNEKAHLCYGARHYYRSTNNMAKLAKVPKMRPPIFPSDPPAQSLESMTNAYFQKALDSLWTKENRLKKQTAELERLRLTDAKAYKKLMKNGPKLANKWFTMADAEQQDIRNNQPAKYKEYQDAVRLLEKVDLEETQIIYVVPQSTFEQPYLKPQLFYPDGRDVRPGDLIKNAQTGVWYMALAPAIEDANFAEPVKMESYQDEYDGGKWKMRPVGSGPSYDLDTMTGHYVIKNHPLPNNYARPTKVIFQQGNRRDEGSKRDYFRFGYWWTKAEVDKAEGNASAVSMPVLPPLKLGVADHIAMPVERVSIERLQEDKLCETAWQKHARLEQEKLQWGQN